MTFEINDKARGARKKLTLPSSTSWDDLRDRVSHVFNIHPASLQLQYRFSNENKNSLPFDLCSYNDYIEMCDQLRPFVIPKILSNGKPSKSIRKLVVVQLFCKGMEGVSDEKGKGVKVSIWITVTSIAGLLVLSIFYWYRDSPNHLLMSIRPQASKTNCLKRRKSLLNN